MRGVIGGKNTSEIFCLSNKQKIVSNLTYRRTKNGKSRVRTGQLGAVH